MANITEIQKALYPHIPKIYSSIPYPFKYLKKTSRIPLSFWPIAQYPQNTPWASKIVSEYDPTMGVTINKKSKTTEPPP